MKSLILFSLGALLLCAPASAQIERQVSVTGIGEVRAEPDMASVALLAQAQRSTTAAAKREVDLQVNRLLALLDGVGLDEENLRAGQIRIFPRYNYVNDSREFLGYDARRDISVSIPNLEKLNAFLDAAVSEKISGINNIEYQSSREQELAERAREMAIADSKQKAAALAEAYGARLGPVVSVNYQTSRVTPINYGAQPEMARMALADTQGRYIPDQLSVEDSISVVFQLLIDGD